MGRGQAILRATALSPLIAFVLASMALAAKNTPSRDEPLWSLQPIVENAPPAPKASDATWIRNPIDAFVLAKLREKGLSPSPEADRRTLIRRLKFDLLGLPPTPDEIAAFLADASPDAYKELVDRLLASPHYGERLARQWMDVVRYGDTHGFDKDKVRPNAWLYRDYLIRSFNQDKPYGRFVKEQLAGDALYPDTADGVVALGFIAAGPWDFVGQVELREGTLDKAITRNLDRDDMVSATANTFLSLTVQCARCHDHKFDPISQKDYYALQAVFAGVDRADRPYEPDEAVGRRRKSLNGERAQLVRNKIEWEQSVARNAGPELFDVEKRLSELKTAAADTHAEFGYHSAIESKQDVVKWVQVDLGETIEIDRVELVGAFDDFNHIGAGFGFPVRYKVELSKDPKFETVDFTPADRTGDDKPNPGVQPVSLDGHGLSARYVRVTATKLAPRQNDFIFALGELAVYTKDGANVARGKAVTSLDSIEAPPRWSRRNLVDGLRNASGTAEAAHEVESLQKRRDHLLAEATNATTRERLAEINDRLETIQGELKTLSPPAMVFAAASDFKPEGSFAPTHGAARPIFLLRRGSEKNPAEEVAPAALACVPGLPGDLNLPSTSGEADRRAALANWIADRRNPLTWRSIVNRVWQRHFGRGIVETPSDFGRMGAAPTHPELLDFLAARFRDGGQSVKELDRLIVTSATYRQVSAENIDAAPTDSENRLLWRMDRRKLDAETLRDAALAVSGELDERVGGPGFRNFAFGDDHSPRYEYAEADLNDPAARRRSIYRFIVRSVPDPFMEALDCADPSQSTPKRNETLTALQALALLNDPFMVRTAEKFAARAQAAAPDLRSQISAAYQLAIGRPPTSEEAEVLAEVARSHGLTNACRLILNLNEFVFVD